MRLGRILRQWILPVLLGLAALGAWQAANRADFDPVDATPEIYDQSLTTPMLSGRRVPQTLRAPLSDELIAAEIAQITQPLFGQPACVAVSDGEQLLGPVLEVPGGVIPASNQKLLTTWAALELLGPDFTFTTRVLTAAPIVDGVVEGDVHLVGDGDPFLVTDDWIAQYADVEGRFHTRLEDLAATMANAGITTINGSVLGDETLYDDIRYGPWDNRLIIQKQSGPLSALTVNEGFVDWPEEFRESFRPRTDTENPPLHSASVFNQLLAELGITVTGAPGVGPAPAGSSEVASIASPPLTDIVTHINSHSSNIGAELLLKRIGLAVAGDGSTATGSLVVANLMTERGLPMTDVVVTDGSGLSETNRLTCAALIALLDQSGPDTAFGQSLPVGAESGTLELRFVDAPAAGLVSAKSGTLLDVRSLSGYVRSAAPASEGLHLTFAQIINSEEAIAIELVETVQEPLVNALVTFPGGPTIAELSPLSPIPN